MINNKLDKPCRNKSSIESVPIFFPIRRNEIFFGRHRKKFQSDSDIFGFRTNFRPNFFDHFRRFLERDFLGKPLELALVDGNFGRKLGKVKKHLVNVLLGK